MESPVDMKPVIDASQISEERRYVDERGNDDNDDDDNDDNDDDDNVYEMPTYLADCQTYANEEGHHQHTALDADVEDIGIGEDGAAIQTRNAVEEQIKRYEPIISLDEITQCGEYPCNVLNRVVRLPVDILNITCNWHDLHNTYHVKSLDKPKHYVIRPDYVRPCMQDERKFVANIVDPYDYENVVHLFNQIREIFNINATFVIEQCINVFLKNRSDTETLSLNLHSGQRRPKYQEMLYAYHFRPLIRSLGLFKRVYAVELSRMFSSLRYTTTRNYGGYFPPFLYLSATMDVYTVLHKMNSVCSISADSIKTNASRNASQTTFSLALQIYNYSLKRPISYTLCDNTTEELILMLSSKSNAVICGIVPHYINNNNNSCCWPA